MDRRRFLVTSLAASVAAPVTVAAQATRVARVGLLAPWRGLTPRHEAFREALRGLGWVEASESYERGGEPCQVSSVPEAGSRAWYGQWKTWV